jgi:excisionase family DNA binding protein
MKIEKYLPENERWNKIEGDLQLIKSMLKEILDNQANGNATTKERIMNVNEASDFIGIEKHVLYAKSANGQIPCFRVGKLYKFKRSALIQWMDNQGLNQTLDSDEYVSRYLQKNILKG